MEKLEYLLRFLVPDAMMGLLLFDFCFRFVRKSIKSELDLYRSISCLCGNLRCS